MELKPMAAAIGAENLSVNRGEAVLAD